jgi:hypothetical protein
MSKVKFIGNCLIKSDKRKELSKETYVLKNVLPELVT